MPIVQFASKENLKQVADKVFNGVEYDNNPNSETYRKINFYHVSSTGSTLIASLDATPFVIDGMVDEVKIENGNLVITFNTDAGKQAISIPLTDIFNPANYYDKTVIDTASRVIAEALLQHDGRLQALSALLRGEDAATLPYLKAQTMEADELYMYGAPFILKSKVAGAPSTANIPDNWDEEKSNVWNGCPRFIGQRYIDQVSKKVYEAVTLTNSTADWVALN